MAADECADRRTTQLRRGIYATQDVLVRRLPLVRVGVEVVAVVGERGRVRAHCPPSRSGPRPPRQSILIGSTVMWQAVNGRLSSAGHAAISRASYPEAAANSTISSTTR